VSSIRIARSSLATKGRRSDELREFMTTHRATNSK
jgi:hypothetical protein